MLSNKKLISMITIINSITDRLYCNSKIDNLIIELLVNNNRQLDIKLDYVDELLHRIHLNLEVHNYKHSLRMIIILDHIVNSIISEFSEY